MERESYKSQVQFQSFHTDNGVFKAKLFRTHLTKHNQDISFSGVGAHHQNGIAEREIRTLIERAKHLYYMIITTGRTTYP